MTQPANTRTIAQLNPAADVQGTDQFMMQRADAAFKATAAQIGAYVLGSITYPVTSVAGRTGAVILTKADVGLGNVDNTSDANKPIGSATQTALDLKAPINSPSFTGTVSGITSAMVGLGNVNNTSDANKPVSTATQAALNAKQNTITLTTTGSSGAATLVGDTLNIPQYSGAAAASIVKRPRVTCLSTSLLGFQQSPYEYLVTKHGDRVERCINGGVSGAQAIFIAERLFTNVIGQADEDTIVQLCIASNDILGGVTTDAPAPGSGSIANAKYYTLWCIEQCLAAGLKVQLLSEPYRQLPQVGANTNVLYWNNTYLPSLVALYNSPNLIYTDFQAAVANPSTGAPLIPIITQVATGSAGASSFTVPDATGITRGMMVHDGSGKLNTSTLTKRVTDIVGNTITFSGTIAAGGIAENVYFYVDYYDNVHSSPVGANKMADWAIDGADGLVAAGWAPDVSYAMSPVDSATPSATVDNAMPNGTLEGSETGGVGAGWATNFSGAKAVVVRTGFRGKAQKATMVPGESAGKYFLSPSADVKKWRGGWVTIGITAEYVGLQPNGAVIDVRCNPDQPARSLPATFTAETVGTIYWSNISPTNGLHYYFARVFVDYNQSSYSWNFTNNLAFPAGAATNGEIYLGNAFVVGDNSPMEDYGFKGGGVDLPDWAVSGYTLSGYDTFVAFNMNSGAASKALPAASTWVTESITVAKSDAGANALTITGAIGGNVVLSTQGANATFRRAGNNIYRVT